MYRIVALFVSLLILVSCSEKKEKVINFSDQIPKSERDYDVVDTLDTVDLLKKELIAFQSLDANIQSLRKVEERAFIDRFRPKTSEKFTLFYKNQADSVHYGRWTFADSTKTKSAFYNWMDHQEIAYFGSQERILKEAFTMIYSDTMILMVSGAVNNREWRKIFEEKELIKEKDYLIEQRKYGNAKWYQRTEKEFKLLQE